MESHFNTNNAIFPTPSRGENDALIVSHRAHIVLYGFRDGHAILAVVRGSPISIIIFQHARSACQTFNARK